MSAGSGDVLDFVFKIDEAAAKSAATKAAEIFQAEFTKKPVEVKTEKAKEDSSEKGADKEQLALERERAKWDKMRLRTDLIQAQGFQNKIEVLRKYQGFFRPNTSGHEKVEGDIAALTNKQNVHLLKQEQDQKDKRPKTPPDPKNDPGYVAGLIGRVLSREFQLVFRQLTGIPLSRFIPPGQGIGNRIANAIGGNLGGSGATRPLAPPSQATAQPGDDQSQTRTDNTSTNTFGNLLSRFRTQFGNAGGGATARAVGGGGEAGGLGLTAAAGAEGAEIATGAALAPETAGISLAVAAVAAALTIGAGLISKSLSKIGGMLDGFVEKYGRFNPAVRGQQAQLQVAERQQNIQLGNALQPLSVAWLKIQQSVIKIENAFIPLVGLIARIGGAILNGVNLILKAFNKILEWLGLASKPATTSMNAAFVNSMRNVSPGEEGARGTNPSRTPGTSIFRQNAPAAASNGSGGTPTTDPNASPTPAAPTYRAPPAFMPQMNMNINSTNNFDIQNDAALQEVLNDVRKGLLGMIDTAGNETRMLASRIIGANAVDAM